VPRVLLDCGTWQNFNITKLPAQEKAISKNELHSGAGLEVIGAGRDGLFGAAAGAYAINWCRPSAVVGVP